MKLQGHISRKANGKEYVKNVLVIPPVIVKQLGWEIGREIQFTVKSKSLVLK